MLSVLNVKRDLIRTLFFMIFFIDYSSRKKRPIIYSKYNANCFYDHLWAHLCILLFLFFSRFKTNIC